MSRPPIGEGCECVEVHSPAAYVGAKHHIVPQSWGGKTVESNLVVLCPSSHTATHRLIDEYVRAGGEPGWEVRRHFGVYVRMLAEHAWSQRPAKPTITSLSEHDTYAPVKMSDCPSPLGTVCKDPACPVHFRR